MRFQSYLQYKGKTESETDANRVLTRRDSIAYLRGDFQGDTARFRHLMTVETAAVQDAQSMSGRFPLVLYAAGWNSLSPDNTVLAEYLASHGFVVATVPQLPTTGSSSELAVTNDDLLTQQRDLDVALGYLVTRSPMVDPQRIALMGYSMGGVVQLLGSMQHANIRAYVGLDPSLLSQDWSAFTEGLNGFDPWRMRTPALLLRAGSRTVGPTSRVVLDRMGYADRYLGTVASATHGDFSDYPRIVSVVGGAFGSAEPLASAVVAHRAIIRCAHSFLVFALTSRVPESARFDTARCRDISIEPLARADIPSTQAVLTTLASTGIEGTLRLVDSLRRRYPTLTVIHEREVNAAAYSSLRSGNAAAAIDAFRLNALTHPQSANAFDSLADGYLAIGDSTGFRTALAQVLRVAEQDTSLSSSLRAALMTRARRSLGTPPQSPPD